ncbi:acetylornithine deacetylase [Aliishimia ponticola]|uniref:Acetylornithine deacetylase n=1 Tax=Aliishimia ponticola TaxID=2499833 RepID=A0A4S4NH83_9RHOB|nr:acetylornithine deacetylase [Aliishimia ponticola]THH39009.1 acetylornithine deacetylase [Aliishimia ponticola]
MPQRLSPLEIMTKLISFPTVSRDTNLPLIDWVEGYLGAHGISAHRWPDPDQPEKAGLFAHVGPEVEGAVVLSGHTDVVPVDGQPWTSDPWTVTERDGRYYGRGTCDMKGFDALAIWALVEGKYRGLKTPLQIALSIDEEIGCTGAPPMIAAMQEVLPKGGAVIVGEPSEMRAVTGHKGGQGFATEVVGFEVHSSIHYQGVSAIHEGARLIQWANEVNAENAAAEPGEISALFDPPYTSWHVGTIEGGTAHNITAKSCRFVMGHRAVPGDDPAVLARAYQDKVDEVRSAMQAVRPEADIVITPTFSVPPLKPEAEGGAEHLVRSITGDNGTHVVSYGTEAGHFQAAGYSTVVCGPGNIEQAHQPDEFIEKSEFEAGQAFMEKLLDRLAG